MTASTPLIQAPASRSARLIRLTPLIDVIFILLIFFMLASTLEDHGRVPLGIAEGGASNAAPTDQVHIDLLPGAVRIDGQAFPASNVAEVVRQRLRETSGGMVTIRTREGVGLERLLRTTADLRMAGIDDIALVPAAER